MVDRRQPQSRYMLDDDMAIGCKEWARQKVYRLRTEVFASSITGTIFSALSIVYVESSTPDACVASLRALSRPTSVELGSANAAMRRAFGNNSIRSSCRLPSSSVARILIPVVLPPGLARERTSPAASM